MPDARLIITIDFCDNFPQINLMVPLKISHQMVMGLDIVRKKEEKNDCLKAFMINKVN